jgi:hypothetical protein
MTAARRLGALGTAAVSVRRMGLGRLLNALLDAGNGLLLQDEGRSCHYTREVA